MIRALIFSKDRASQLKLLLDSIEVNCPNALSVTVLYKHSTPEFENGYKKLMEEKKHSVEWVLESDFKNQVVSWTAHAKSFTCFLTDDDIIYQNFDLETIENTLNEDSNVFCFSLRLGKNVTKCYTMKCNNVLVPLEENESIVKWDWTKHYADFGYPLSVDGHVFRANEIAKISRMISYSNPNTFEASMQVFENYPKPKMASFITSKLVNTPSNVVQDVFQNRAGEEHGYSVKDLNDKFLAGESIDLTKIDFSKIEGCHQELEYVFIKEEVKV